MGHGVGEAEKKAKELVERMVRWGTMTMEMVRWGWLSDKSNGNGVVLFWSTEMGWHFFRQRNGSPIMAIEMKYHGRPIFQEWTIDMK